MKSPAVPDPANEVSPAAAQPHRLRLWRWLPILRLAERHRPRLMRHLLSLQAHDRYLRFGYPASDERIVQYVQSLNFQRDELFGIFDRRLELVAMSHLAYADADTESAGDRASAMTEFAVSVRSIARGRGYGKRLFAHAVRHARNRSIDRLMIHALSENTAMLRIARKAGAVVKREGSDSEAWLELPPHNLASRMEEAVSDQASALNYQFKVQVRQIGWALAVIQEVKRRLSRRRQIASH
jgi:GNAT superfamily N-acetyltransferase